MSVILDALRKARGQAPARPAAAARPAEIPAGLRMGGAKAKPQKAAGGTRWGLIGGVLVAAVAVWGGVYFGLPVLLKYTSRSRVALAGPRDPAATTAKGGLPEPGKAGMPSISEMIDKVNAPPVIAPRAMPGVRPSVNGTPGAEAVPGAVVLPIPGSPTAPAAPPATPATPAPRTATARPARRPAPPRPAVPAAPAPETTRAVVTAPPPPEVNHFDLAVRYQSLGNFEQALAHYSAVLQTQEFNVEARNNLGLLYLDRGLTTEAIDQFKRAILINPEYLKARGNLAVALMNAGRLDEARAELRAAIALAPRNADLLVNMALVEKAARHPEQAKETLLRALGVQPTHAAAHYNLAVLYDEAGDSAQAYDEYNDFLKNAGPEYGARLSDVRRRVDAIAPKLDAVR